MNIGLIDVDKTRFPNLALGKMAASPTTPTARAGRKEEKTMTKHYFVSYMCQTGARIMNRHCLYKAVNQPLYEICNDIAEINNTTPNSVIITCLKDLTEEEYQMLKGEEE